VCVRIYLCVSVYVVCVRVCVCVCVCMGVCANDSQTRHTRLDSPSRDWGHPLDPPEGKKNDSIKNVYGDVENFFTLQHTTTLCDILQHTAA